MKHLVRALSIGFFALAAPVGGQEPVPPSLTLEQAIEIARGDNPRYRQTLNDEVLADANVRQAWGQLLPQATAGAGV